MENIDTKTDTKQLLSVLWIFILFNIIFRDIHQLITKDFITEIMSGVVNGTQITEELLFIGGFLVEIPILMVLLSRFLPYKANRLANLITATITLLVIISNTPSDMDDVFFMTIEVVAIFVIIWKSWKWANPKKVQTV